jgi:glycosyltransferase involved in cell wall biosynthesis
MNFVFFTPAAKKSAIGRMVALVTHSLTSRGSRVRVVRTESSHLLNIDTHDFRAQLFPWTNFAQVESIVAEADACIYHVGDNFEFHEGCLHWMFKRPGVVCLHDFFLGNLFWTWSQENRTEAECVLRRWYGPALASKYFSFSDSESFILGTHGVMPMTEWICSQADGVITHSLWGCDRVLKSCYARVQVCPIAYNMPSLACKCMPFDFDQEEPLRLLTIGHMNSNKRVKSVIKSISESSLLKEQVIYRLVGSITPKTRTELALFAERVGVNLLISGEVSDSEMAAAIIESDVISCLRWPALEAGSASAVEAMLYGKAIMVTDTGFYSEIPSSCVVKINPHNEVNEIRLALEAFLGDRERALKIGSIAREWASKTFTADNYADKLLEFAVGVSKSAPIKNALTKMLSILSKWSEHKDIVSSPELINPLRIFEI